ncbi:MAG: hypothetical protein DWQ34_01965 [Planctomycetota bacterium]|nr:MAG: hypothetical protein DWQ29_11390 [Planctomycetota bacterium]REJ97532.1 MAG: hypothetical protein DWQ34_01965 [Planctomycetota bacterium]REK23063.1 MAG: hypothetical protein DWQ41_17980 [Planctomycetota bacterium]REK34079.1 MAG: hypothetical protein DWQ45_14010 [Planctomycetota bacterium]
MSKREKILAAGLAAVIAIFVIGPAVMSAVLSPLRERDNRINTLKTSVAKLDDAEFALLAAKRDVNRWREMSLPPDPLDAQRVYYQWLNDVTLLAGWQEVEMTLGTASPRQGGYTTIPVTIEAEATLDQIDRFIRFLDSTRLLQRVTRLDIESPYPDGNPPMHVVIGLEGVGLQEATPRSRLFPISRLQSNLADDDQQLRLDGSDGFPEETPFRIRIDQELLRVDDVDGDTWRVTRGVDHTEAAPHEADSVVELTPQIEDDATSTAETELLVERIFVKADNRTPAGVEIAALDAPSAMRGQPWSAELSLANWDSRRPVKYAIDGDVPPGLTLDADTGRLEWTPPADAELGYYEPEVTALSADGRETIATGSVEIELRRPNSPPTLVLPETVDVWLGQELVLTPEVKDPDLAEEEFLFEIEGDLPEDASFDEQTGTLTWTPPVSTDIGDIVVTISVSDDGRPRETDSQDVVLKLQDDPALYTYLLGGIIQGADRRVWFRNRAAEESEARIVLSEGDEWTLANLEMTIETVRIDSIDVAIDGRLYRLENGENLRQLQPVAENPADSSSSTTARSGE